jgi:hypothetical protein
MLHGFMKNDFGFLYIDQAWFRKLKFKILVSETACDTPFFQKILRGYQINGRKVSTDFRVSIA